MAAKPHSTKWIYVALALIGAAMTWHYFLGDPNVGNDPDARFSYKAFRGLALGDQEVASLIDWDHLHAIQVNVGDSYVTTPQEQRPNYQRMFIMSFANGFKMTGARPNSFRNWRVVARDGELVTVATDHKTGAKTLLLTVNAREPKKLVGMEWQL